MAKNLGSLNQMKTSFKNPTEFPPIDTYAISGDLIYNFSPIIFILNIHDQS